jgi:hypothetical protein
MKKPFFLVLLTMACSGSPAQTVSGTTPDAAIPTGGTEGASGGDSSSGSTSATTSAAGSTALGGTTAGKTTSATGGAALGGTSAGKTTTGGSSAVGGTTASKTTTGGSSAVGGTTASKTITGGSSAVGGTTAGTTTSSAGSGASSALGAYPVSSSPKTRGGTMTFTNIGAAGWWPRRIDRPAGDPACTYKDGTDTWGGHCCMTEANTTSTTLSPFDEELTLILKAINVRQLAIYQPSSTSSVAWDRVTAWDARTQHSENLWFTQQGNGSTTFPGDLTKNDCVGYVMQQPMFTCGDYYCPNDSGIMHQGFPGSKLVVLMASMTFSDSGVTACGSTDAGKPSPWVAIVASELVRDGGRKWNGLCNCYSKTNSVGDGCGEINIFEVVMDNNSYSNREFASTGVRSYQAGHIGGAVAGASLSPSAFAADSEVVDACAKAAYTQGPVLVAGGDTDGCPIWKRPNGDRYFFILLDESTRTIQVGVIHPESLPAATNELLPNLPANIGRSTVDAMVAMRLPG